MLEIIIDQFLNVALIFGFAFFCASVWTLHKAISSVSEPKKSANTQRIQNNIRRIRDIRIDQQPHLDWAILYSAENMNAKIIAHRAFGRSDRQFFSSLISFGFSAPPDMALALSNNDHLMGRLFAKNQPIAVKPLTTNFSKHRGPAARQTSSIYELAMQIS